MKRYLFIISVIFAVCAFTSCKDPYMPKLKADNVDVLVVEGFIDGADNTIITLSRVRMLSVRDTAAKKFVTGAIVYVENNSGDKFPLYEQGNGKYSAFYNFDFQSQYRLRILTAEKKEYVSDFVNMKVSPAIQSLDFNTDSKGAVISINTRDVTNKTTFYRWRFDDTWEFHSTYLSEFKYNRFREKIEPRTEQVRVCWQSDHSKGILLGSTAKLQKDEIRNMPIQRIPYGDYRLSVLYSIRVTQYALDSLAYNFWSLLKKNSEDMGTLFDPQPDNIRGNVHSVTDPDEPIIGYIGAGFSYSRRVFFRVQWSYSQNCPQPYLVPNIKDSIDFYFANGGYTPMYPEVQNDTTGWIGAFNLCADCTLRGTNVKPFFWP